MWKMSGPSPKRAEAFWKHWARFAAPGNLSAEALESAYDEGARLLRRYDEALGLEVQDGASGNPGLLITAFGNPDHRASIGDLMAAKPDIPGLEVVAFRPAHKEDFEFEIEGYAFDTTQMWFGMLGDDDDPAFLGLDMYFRKEQLAPDDVLITAAGLAAQTLMGEVAFMEKVGLLRLGDRNADPTEFVPLVMLKKFAHD